NFTWDWILEPMVDGTDDAWIVERLASDYRSGTIYYRLPLGASTAPFPRLEAAPLVGRRARLPRERTREILDLSDRPARPVALVRPGRRSPDRRRRAGDPAPPSPARGGHVSRSRRGVGCRLDEAWLWDRIRVHPQPNSVRRHRASRVSRGARSRARFAGRGPF